MFPIGKRVVPSAEMVENAKRILEKMHGVFLKGVVILLNSLAIGYFRSTAILVHRASFAISLVDGSANSSSTGG